jgi:ribonuclease H / adenosylcobalamin/alpha-ribazole phosphatase
LATTVLLVRAGETIFREQGRLLGRRDIGLTPEGKQHAELALQFIRDLQVNEILASPMARTIQTADVLAQHFRLGVGRDPRLVDLDVGKWEGVSWEELLKAPAFADYFAGEATRFPDGEDLEGARRRAVASIEDAGADNPLGATLVLVTHGPIIQLMLAHYLGMPTGAYARIQVDHGAVSVVRFYSDMQPAQVLGVNQGVPLAGVLASFRPLGAE